MTIFAPKEKNLTRPLGLSVEAVSGLKFKIRFYVSNQEEIFLGYNLYSSKASITDADFINDEMLNLILPKGHVPSFAYSRDDFDPKKPEVKIIEFFDGKRVKFECGQKYYFRMRAYGEGRKKSPGSNSASDTAFKDTSGDCSL
jgi:hypothetical protein